MLVLERRVTLIKFFDKALTQLSLQKSLTWPWDLLALCLPCLCGGSVWLKPEGVQMELKRPTRDLLIWIYQFALVQTSWVQGPTNSEGRRAKVELLIFYIVGCSINVMIQGVLWCLNMGGGDLRIIALFVFSTLKNLRKLSLYMQNNNPYYYMLTHSVVFTGTSLTLTSVPQLTSRHLFTEI